MYESKAGLFQRYFSVEVVNGPLALEEVLRVRYNVYCKEFGYEPIENFPDGMEHDEYDIASAHCLVRHRRTGRVAGCVRVIPAEGGGLLPFMTHCPESIDPLVLNSLRLDPSLMCEVSRLAVDTPFRRLLREGSSEGLDLGEICPDEQQAFSLIAVAAFYGAAALCGVMGRLDTISMMEPMLPRLLRRTGIHARKLGPDVEYHGRRGAYYIDQRRFPLCLPPEFKGLYLSIADAVESQSVQGEAEQYRRSEKVAAEASSIAF